MLSIINKINVVFSIRYLFFSCHINTTIYYFIEYPKRKRKAYTYNNCAASVTIMSNKINNQMISTLAFAVLVFILSSSINVVSALPTTVTFKKEPQTFVNDIDISSHSHTLSSAFLKSKNHNKEKRADEVKNEEERPDTPITANLCIDFEKGGKNSFRDPHSCTRYYKCMQNDDQEEEDRYDTSWFECNTGYSFDESAQKCVKENNVECTIQEKKKAKSSAVSLRGIPTSPLSCYSHFSIVALWMIVGLGTLLLA